nr:TonB family protein [Mucilaginibacter sp. UR6-1]
MLIWRLTAAASIVVILGIGGLLFFKEQPKKKEIALAEIKPQPPVADHKNLYAPPAADLSDSAEKVFDSNKPANSPYIASVKPKQQLVRRRKQPTELILDAEPVANETIADKQLGALQEKIAVDFFAQKAKPVADTIKEVKQHTIANALAGRVAGLSITKNSPRYKTITGKVTDGVAPLPGVTVQGINNTTVTDVDGEFSLTVPEKSTLNFGYIGFENQKVKVRNQDSLMIAMEPSQGSLNEVVVVSDYGSKRKIKEAHPLNGWDEFNEYLKENAISSDGKKGTVKLSFTVNTDGSLTDFEITKNLSDETDQQAIALIKDGPKWVGDSSGQPKKIKLSIKFRAE